MPIATCGKTADMDTESSDLARIVCYMQGKICINIFSISSHNAKQYIFGRTQYSMAVLNSNPEILLRKRKDADRKRAEKQQQDIEKQAKTAKLMRKKKFIRAETLVSNYKSNELEMKRIRALTKNHERLASAQDFEPLKNPQFRLLFIIRVPNHTKGLSIPTKARQVLQVLRLTEINTGVFIKASELTMNLLNLVAPYIVFGKPSLSSIRQLFQKRARIISHDQDDSKQEEGEPQAKATPIRLDNNQTVENEFGESLGLVCIEDLIHEIVSLTENFNTVTKWLVPFQLNPPVNGWGPVEKLARIIHNQENQTKISLSQDFRVSEIGDIDSIIEHQN